MTPPRDLDLDWDDPEPEPAERGDARKNLGDAMNDGITPEFAREMLARAKEATVGVKAHCPECGAEQTVKFPDFKGIVSTITALLEQAEGRPELRGPDAVQVFIERPPL